MTVLTYRLKDDEKAHFEHVAKQEYNSHCATLVQKIVRELIHKKPTLLKNDMAEIRRLTYELKAIGNNLNQISKKYNAEDVLDQYSLQDTLKNIANLLSQTKTEIDQFKKPTLAKVVKNNET